MTDHSNRSYLRHMTDAAHARAELGWTEDGRFTARRRYDDWLAALLKTHLSLGLPASRALAEGAEEEEARIAALCADLAVPVILPRQTAPMDPAAAWGVGYALNGAALGASLLLKGGGTASDWPTAYLQRMQNYARSGALKHFFAALDQTPLDRTAAAKGASTVFAHLTQTETSLMV